MSTGEGTTTEVFNDLADLFLGRDASTMRLAPRAPAADHASVASPSATQRTLKPTPRSPHEPVDVDRRLHVDALIIGHLPVAVAPWIGQCAAEVARQEGAAALVRSIAGEARIELFPCGVDRADLNSLLTAADGVSLVEARDLASAWFPNWIVSLEQIEDIDRLQAMCPDRIVLVTGADQAAVVGAYQLLKRMATLARSALPISVIIAGASAEAGEVAFERLDRAARDFLGCALTLLKVIPRVEPTSSRTLTRYQHDGNLVQWLNDGGKPGATDPRVATAIPKSMGSIDTNVNITTNGNADADFDTDPPVPLTPRRVDRSSSMSGRRDGDPVRRTAPASSTPRRALDDESAELAGFVAGIQPLRVQCPRAPLAQLALDEHGRLHVLMQDGAGEERIESVLVAAEWAIEHEALLAMIDNRFAQGQAIDDVTLHLFTDEPRRRKRLLGGRWRIHLLLDRNGASAGRWTHVDIT